MSLSDDKKTDIIDALNTRYLNDILKIYNINFDNLVSEIYLAELQPNEASISDTNYSLVFRFALDHF